MSARSAWLLALCLAGAACSSQVGARKATVPRNDAIIALQCPVADAELWVNDRFIGPVRGVTGGIALSPGEHRIEIRHDQYHTHYEELRVSARERRTLVVELAEILP